MYRICYSILDPNEASDTWFLLTESSSKTSLSTRLYEWTTLQKSFPKCEMITAGKGINKFF